MRTTSFRGNGKLAALTAAAVGALWLGAAERVAAQEVPPGCSFAGAGAAVTRVPPTTVEHGQEICYRVQYNNGIAGVNCEIRNFSADLTLPDGSSVSIFSNVTILSGEAVICPSADPRCATASNCTIMGQEGYSYTVSHGDEIDSFNGCPPVVVPGTGRVVAYTEGNGDSLTNPPDAAAACATANNIVPHACCDPCTGECTNVVSAGDCTAPGVFHPDATCNEGPCEPLDCDDNNECTDDSCNPTTGMCVHEDNSDRCDDMDPCTEDRCDPATGCVNTPECVVDGDCMDDGDLCTIERCVGGCCETEPRDCDDGNACTADSCDPATGCVNTPIDCNDMDPCTEDSCDPATGCVNTPECMVDGDCMDDGDLCTIERCVDGCCETEPVVCDECQECDPMTGMCVDIDPPPPGCGEFAGCTPGFWKQPHHLQYWVGYSPGDSYDTVFGVTSSFGADFTLLDALWQGGGGEIALGRHAVAALLNSTRGDVEYFYSTMEVIDLVQQAYATGDFNGIKNMLAAQNELGCTVVKRPDNNTSVVTPQEKKTIRSGR